MSTERVVPHNLEAETCVLGAILIDNQQFTTAALFIDSTSFFRDAHRRIWNAMAALAERGDGIDLVTVKDELARNAELEQIGGPVYIARLVDGIPRASNVDHYAKIIREKATLRSIIAAAGRIVADAYECQESPSAILANATQLLVGLEGRSYVQQIPPHVRHISEVMTDIRTSWEAGPPVFVRTPWPDLDDKLEGGLLPTELCVLGARPGMGKSAAAGQITRKVARDGGCVLVFSREMKDTQIGGRMIAMEANVPAGAIRRVTFSPDQRRDAHAAMERLSGLPIFITDAPVTIEAIREIVRVFQRTLSPLRLVVVDYLQMIDVLAPIRERRLQVEAVTRGLKQLAKDENLVVLALSSVSRGMTEKDEPTLRSLRESGNIESDADVVVFLHSPDPEDSTKDVIIAKARAGRVGRLQLHFNKTVQRFDQVASTREYGA